MIFALEEHFINYLDIEDKPFDFLEINFGAIKLFSTFKTYSF